MVMASRHAIRYDQQQTKQEKAVEEVERVIRHYTGLEEVTPDLVFVVDREMVIRYVNRIAARLLNRDIREMTGKYLELFFPKTAYEAQLRRLRQVFRSGTTGSSTGLVPFARTELFLSTKLVPIKDMEGNIPAVLAVSRDVSELRPPSVCESPDDESLLSEREAEVLNLVAEGMTNKEIGQALFISPKTVDVHRTRIMKKLHAHNTAELILRSRRTGLLL
jgi:PAS domain S-box-containing protein